MDSVAGGVQTLDRAVQLLEAVATSGRATLADLVQTTGLARPTAHRLAVALEKQGLLARDDDGRFRLGSRLVAWGAAAARDFPLADAARPVLAQLVDETGESAQLYVRDADRRVCVAARERSSGLRDTVPLGAVLPLNAGSGAKVLLAWADDADRFDVDPRVLAGVRQKGWAESVAEREAGVASVSAPVRDRDGRVVAAISVSGPIDRMGRRPGRRLADAVLAAAARLSAS
ncbi:MAG: transcriptional regulator, IclR family [Actinomycetia bacterium]|nr:transcriptional regulator, IclR family [Actinomycetes bacterium]